MKKMLAIVLTFSLSYLFVTNLLIPLQAAAQSDNYAAQMYSPEGAAVQDRGSCKDLERARLRPKGFCNGSWKPPHRRMTAWERNCLKNLGYSALATMITMTWASAVQNFGFGILACYV
ncbi:hypothetical protein [Culicoidibacter larvae]|uniref:Uncharacterized protein n=1 Tax=Culicoidibacter larvae TaxID=2579976 RepID=A0A5R8QF47_9FIRM|nr:hypothetical protein [Culicoidibacter larvae]TLG75289.1 hypothetical protein FEZ08_04375 [Culicoidibacter larvae]